MRHLYLPLAMIASITIAAVTLTSGNVTLNHVPHLEKLIQSNTFKYQTEDGALSVYLTSDVSEPDSYDDLIMLLNAHKNDKQINIYLAGNGGHVSSALNLFYTIQSMPANVTMIVRGDVYSAHAMLALAGDQLTVLNTNSLFLFHIPAAMWEGNYVTMEKYCSNVKGTDRGISTKDKCLRMTKALNKTYAATMEQLLITKVLTAEQVKQYYRGEDVIITGGTIIRQLEK